MGSLDIFSTGEFFSSDLDRSNPNDARNKDDTFRRSVGGHHETVRQLRSLGASNSEIANVLGLRESDVAAIQGTAGDLDADQINVLFQGIMNEETRAGAADFFGELKSLETARSFEAGAAVNVGQGQASALRTEQR